MNLRQGRQKFDQLWKECWKQHVLSHSVPVSTRLMKTSSDRRTKHDGAESPSSGSKVSEEAEG